MYILDRVPKHNNAFFHSDITNVTKLSSTSSDDAKIKIIRIRLVGKADKHTHVRFIQVDVFNTDERRRSQVSSNKSPSSTTSWSKRRQKMVKLCFKRLLGKLKIYY